MTEKFKITGANEQPGAVKKKVKETEAVMWAERIETKKSSHWGSITQANKRSGKGIFTITLKAVRYFFDARAGCLRARTYRSKYSPQDEACVCCVKIHKQSTT